MLEMLLLRAVRIIMVMHRQRVGIHRPAVVRAHHASLRVDDGVTALGGLDEIGVLLLEDGEVALGLPIPDAVGGEEQIHFLERALVGLRVEGPHHGDGDDVAGAEDVVGVLIEGGEDDGQQEGAPPVANGPAHHAPGVALGADFEREDLGGVEPGYGQPGGAEGGGEDEDHGDGADAVALGGGDVAGGGGILTGFGEGGGEDHGETLHDGAPVECPSAADTIQGEDADQGGEGVGDVVEAGDPFAGSIADDGDTEDGGSVDGHAGDANPFLHDLEPDDELDTAAGVKLTGADAEKHGEVGVVLGCGTFKLGNVLDVLELGFGSTDILTSFTTKASENVASFVVPAHLDKISRRFGEEPHRGSKNKERDDLECDGEPPGEAIVSSPVTVIRTAKF